MAINSNTFTTSSMTGISTMSEEYWRYMQAQAQQQAYASNSIGDAKVAMKQEPQPNPVLLLLED